MMKYKSKKATVNGITFASKLEADRYRELLQMQENGIIHCLTLQPEFQIFRGYVDSRTGSKIRSRFYVADFQYTTENKVIVEDTKGVETDVFRLKWDLVRSLYPQFEFRKLTRKDV